MSKTIGAEPKRLSCRNCEEPYGLSEYFDYMMNLRSTTVDCYKCPAENYVVPKKNGVYWIIKLICYLISAALFVGPVVLIGQIFNADGRVSILLIAGLIALGFALAYGSHFVIMKTFN